MKRALVTGAAKRLGRAMALSLAEQGYDVAVHYASSYEDAGDTAEQVAKRGQAAAVLPADLLNEPEVAALIPQAADALAGR